jgi:hypothetical protein
MKRGNKSDIVNPAHLEVFVRGRIIAVKLQCLN